MKCNHCEYLEERTEKQQKNLASAVLEEIKIKYCPIKKRKIYSKSLGCDKGVISHIYLDNFSRKLKRQESYEDEELGIWY